MNVMEDQASARLSQDFLSRLELPPQKAKVPFLIAIIGLVGSGRTIVAKAIVEKIDGAVLVQANSARFLLREAATTWGDNVRRVLKIVAENLLSQGYGVVFDGASADVEDRQNISEIAEKTGAKVFYVRIIIDPEIAKAREQKKYDNPNWLSNFEDFRVSTTDAMLQNINDRAPLYRHLDSSQISGLIGEINNNGMVEELDQQVDTVVQKIKESP